MSSGTSVGNVGGCNDANDAKSQLRSLQMEAYGRLLSAFRAEGDLRADQRGIVEQLRQMFSVSTERHRAECRRVAADDRLKSIALKVCGNPERDVSSGWLSEGRRVVPLLTRPLPVTGVTPKALIAAEIERLRTILKIQPAGWSSSAAAAEEKIEKTKTGVMEKIKTEVSDAEMSESTEHKAAQEKAALTAIFNNAFASPPRPEAAPKIDSELVRSDLNDPLALLRSSLTSEDKPKSTRRGRPPKPKDGSAPIKPRRSKKSVAASSSFTGPQTTDRPAFGSVELSSDRKPHLLNGVEETAAGMAEPTDKPSSSPVKPFRLPSFSELQNQTKRAQKRKDTLETINGTIVPGQKFARTGTNSNSAVDVHGYCGILPPAVLGLNSLPNNAVGPTSRAGQTIVNSNNTGVASGTPVPDGASASDSQSSLLLDRTSGSASSAGSLFTISALDTNSATSQNSLTTSGAGLAPAASASHLPASLQLANGFVSTPMILHLNVGATPQPPSSSPTSTSTCFVASVSASSPPVTLPTSSTTPPALSTSNGLVTTATNGAGISIVRAPKRGGFPRPGRRVPTALGSTGRMRSPVRPNVSSVILPPTPSGLAAATGMSVPPNTLMYPAATTTGIRVYKVPTSLPGAQLGLSPTASIIQPPMVPSLFQPLLSPTTSPASEQLPALNSILSLQPSSVATVTPSSANEMAVPFASVSSTGNSAASSTPRNPLPVLLSAAAPVGQCLSSQPSGPGGTAQAQLIRLTSPLTSMACSSSAVPTMTTTTTSATTAMTTTVSSTVAMDPSLRAFAISLEKISQLKKTSTSATSTSLTSAAAIDNGQVTVDSGTVSS